MNVPTCIQNKILVEIDSKFQQEIVTSNGLKLYKDASFRPEWSATIKGKVVSVPQKLNIGGGRDSIYPQRPFIEQKVKAGDEIIFSYLVVMDRVGEDNKEERFEEEPHEKYGNPRLTVWKNPKGLKIARHYLNNDVWEVVVVDTNTKECIDAVQGGENDMENMLGKYIKSQNVKFNYKNILPCEKNGEWVDYWMVDYAQVFGIKREDEYEMVGGHIMLDPIKEPKNKTHEQGIIELVGSIEYEKDNVAIGRIKSIAEPLKNKKSIGVKKGDKVIIDSRFLEKYEIDGSDVWITNHDRLLYKTETA